ncbi:MAG: cytochrome b/b6 domain-containing protein [Gammaproteobacteria bacterium]|jgi:formate dehydrogenase subunit gamma|nr:cytochrome b/b6 domain-containing protein [Gammaproteobacteria bacterium]
MSQNKIIRHKLIDRLFHWFLAISILVLLISGLLPVYGFNASLIVIHWIVGLGLTALLLIHICRSLFWKKISSIWFSHTDLELNRERIGKYSLAQKLMHQFIAVLTLAGIITGLIMMVRIDTPLWERDPYWLNADTWGVVFFIHGLVALSFVSVIMLHIYFSLRPESRMYLRSIFKGWITEEEYSKKHDAELWAKENEQK